MDEVIIRPPRPGDGDADTDAEGSFLAESGGREVGRVVSRNRELTWVLSDWYVDPGHRRRGIGTQLLAAGLHHGRGCLRALAVVPDDPVTARLLRRAGLSLHPTMRLVGEVDRSSLPVVDRVREGTEGDVDLLDSLGRRVRGAAHGPDHRALLPGHRLLVTDRPSGSGFAYVDPGGPILLAASTRRTARDLLWEALASTPPGSRVAVEHVTPENEWAVDVGLAAGLELRHGGYLGLRSRRPPAPYLPHPRVL